MGKRNKYGRDDNFDVPINDEIRYYDARVIYKERSDTEGENDFNKVMKVTDAKRIAENMGLDLIEINGNTNPPILRIYDYSKYLFEKKQTAKRKKNLDETKEIHLSVNISKHDMETKANHAMDFLDKGKKVKVVLFMKGRELSRREESSKSFYEFLELIGDSASFVSSPREEGNRIIAIIKQKNK